MKDKAIFSNEFKPLYINCLSCQSPNHYFSQCPMIHKYHSHAIEFFLQKHIFSIPQMRTPKFVRHDKKIFNIKIIMQKAFSITFNKTLMSNYRKEVDFINPVDATNNKEQILKDCKYRKFSLDDKKTQKNVEFLPKPKSYEILTGNYIFSENPILDQQNFLIDFKKNQDFIDVCSDKCCFNDYSPKTLKSKMKTSKSILDKKTFPSLLFEPKENLFKDFENMKEYTKYYQDGNISKILLKLKKKLD